MRFESGRARVGARALLYSLFAAVALFAGGCGNGTIVFGTPVISFSAVPGPFIKYQVLVDAVTLTRSDGAVFEPIGISSGGTTAPQVVDFTRESDLDELFGAPGEPEGTYKSANITVDYSSAEIYVDVGGTPTAVAPIDAATKAAATTITYTITFDPNAPLVITHGVSTPFNITFDLAASNVVSTTSSGTLQTVVKPFFATSTAPAYTKPMFSRGLYVTASPANGQFVINTRPFADLVSVPYGAINVQTNAQTVFNIAGSLYTGSAGLAAIQTLLLNTNIGVVGTIPQTATNALTPTINATQVYAGVAQDSELLDRIFGTVSSRSGNTLNIHGASIVTREPNPANGVIPAVFYVADLPTTVGTATLVSVDGEATAVDIGAISVGQKVIISGSALDSSGNLIISSNPVPTPVSADATAGLVRLQSTTAWGTLNAGAAPGAAALTLVTLGNYVPTALNFAGTGQSASLNANPGSYILNTGGIDLSATAAGTLLRVDGLVTPFGAAPPDFNASAILPGSSTEQVLAVDWVNGGTTAPFTSAGSAGLVVNMANANLGTAHAVMSGPTSVDLTSPLVNVTIVPDSTLPNQFAIGNPAGGISVFNSFSAFLTQLGTVLNGTNAVQKLAAVGHYDAASGTFTAQRIDLVRQ